MAKLWLFLAPGFSQTLTLLRLVLDAEGTYEAHWEVECSGPPPCEVRLPGRPAWTLPLHTSEPALLSWRAWPDTLHGPCLHSEPPHPSNLSPGTPITASYMAADEVEELKGTFQAYLPPYLLIKREDKIHCLHLNHLLEVQYAFPFQGPCIYDATRLMLYPEQPSGKAVFHFITEGILSDSLRFFYLIQELESNTCQLSGWLQVPALFGGDYETNLEVRVAHRYSWPLGRQRLSLHSPFNMRFMQLSLLGREGYLVSIPEFPAAGDTTLYEATARKVFRLTAPSALMLPYGTGWLIRRDGMTLPFEWKEAGMRLEQLYIQIGDEPNIQASVQEARQRSSRKEPSAIAGTIRLWNRLAEPIPLFLEKTVRGMPIPAQVGLARIERTDSKAPLHSLCWEITLASGQTFAVSYGYLPVP